MPAVIGDLMLVRPLGLAGIRSAVMARPHDPVRFSRYAVQVIDWVDAWAEPERLIERLERFASAQQDPPILYYQEDRDLVMISEWRERLSQSFRFVIPAAGLVKDVVDKRRFQALAERCGLRVPRSRWLGAGEGVPPPHVDLEFPLIVKPVSRSGQRWSAVDPAAKAMKVDSQQQLERAWSHIRAGDHSLLAQEFVPGPESAIESYHVYVDGSGATAGEFTGRKIRTWPAEFGTSTAVEVVGIPDVRAEGRTVIERLGLRGVAKLDFKRGPDGKLHLLEVNPRFNLWHYPGAVAGVNVPALVYADLAGIPRPAVAAEPRRVRWTDVRRDRRAAGGGLLGWLAFAISCQARSIGWKDDPGPFPGAAWSRLREGRH